MSEEVKNDFTQGSVKSCIIKMAIPMTTAQLVNVLYSVVDRIYIGHIPGVGSMALTGLGLCTPVITIIAAFSMLVGSGGGPLCSIARGRKDYGYAEKILGNAFSLCLIFGAFLTVGVLCFLKPLLYLFGASDNTFPYAVSYARIYAMGTVFVMISLGMNFYINAQGFAKTGMLTVTIGAVLNIILDPILIFVFNMGIQGAAIATIFSQFCSAMWVLLFLRGSRAEIRLKAAGMKLDGHVVADLLGLGVTGFVMQCTNGLVQVVNNSQLRRYGGDVYVGAMTVIYSINQIFVMVVHGVTDGAKPVLGYNYGAGRYDRVKQGIRFFASVSAVYAIIMWTVVRLFPGQLISLFNDDPKLMEAAIHSMNIYFCGFVFMTLQSSGQSVYVALGRKKQALFFSIFRKVVIVTTLAYVLPLSLGVDGVFWAEPVSDVVGGLACFLTMYFTVYRKLGKDGPVLTKQ